MGREVEKQQEVSKDIFYISVASKLKSPIQMGAVLFCFV